MKNIPLNEMQRIQGGISLQFSCFMLGFVSTIAVALPAASGSLYYGRHAIKYCWNN